MGTRLPKVNLIFLFVILKPTILDCPDKGMSKQRIFHMGTRLPKVT
jgi:hypothetical protein